MIVCARVARRDLHEVLTGTLLGVLQDDVLIESFERHFGLLPCVESSSENNAATHGGPGMFGVRRARRRD